MLRVGLTGGLGSGKSTVAAMLARHGAHVLSADEVGRSLMQPGQPVFAAIRSAFGNGVVLPDGSLNRAELSRLAFTEGRVEELNAIVHPAVLANLAEASGAIGARHPFAVVVVESALIFETRFGSPDLQGTTPVPLTSEVQSKPWHRRFDRIILVVASTDLKIARFVERSMTASSTPHGDPSALIAEAHRRLALQINDETKAALADYVLSNQTSLPELQSQVDALWPGLALEARAQPDA